MKTLALMTSLFLAGCGQFYISADVSDQLSGTEVSIIPLTATTALAANKSSYSPRNLPTAFFQSAGTGRGIVGAGPLPDPVSPQPIRPTGVETRLPPITAQKPYEIGVGDVIVLATPRSASSIEELSGLLASQNQRQGYTVQDDGAITVPDVGRVQLAGLDLEAAESEIFQALVSSQLDPTFNIEIAEFNSKRISVGGAVALPQALPITLAPLTLKEVIAISGGTTSLDTQFTTVRLYRNGTLYQVPYEDLQTIDDITLIANDSIFVDTSYQLEQAQNYFAEQITLLQLRQETRSQALSQLQAEINLRRDALSEARTSFQARLEADAVERDYVYLTGEVTLQGRFPLPFGRQASLADALFVQGGPLPATGNPAEIYLLRGNKHNRVTAFHLDGSNPINMINATKLQLRPNDIVFVSEQPVTRWSRVMEQLVPSLIIAGATAAAN